MYINIHISLNMPFFTIAGKRFQIIWGTGVVCGLISVCVSQIRQSPLRWRAKASTAYDPHHCINSEKPQFTAQASLFQAHSLGDPFCQRRVEFYSLRHDVCVHVWKCLCVSIIYSFWLLKMSVGVDLFVFTLPSHIYKCRGWLHFLVSLTGGAGPKIKGDLTIIMSAQNPRAQEQLSWDCWQHP